MKRVLVVDDAMFIRNALKIMLEKNDYEVVGFGVDGANAIEQYKILQPDIVTMDVTMPVMNGIESLKEIMKIDPSAKVVMVTAMGSEDYIRESILSGASNFIVKPFQEERVISTLRNL